MPDLLTSIFSGLMSLWIIWKINLFSLMLLHIFWYWLNFITNFIFGPKIINWEHAYISQILAFESVYGLGERNSFWKNRINTAEKICSSKMLLQLLGKSQIWLKLLKIKEKDKTTERMWEGELALCRWQNSVPFRTCHRILRTVFSSRPLGHFSSSSRTVWSTNSKTRYSLFFLRNTSIRFTRWSCRSCCNTMEKLCTSFYSTCVKF